MAINTGDGKAISAPEIEKIAAHEFGHVLGMANSTHAADVMSPGGGNGKISSDDAATIRHLYGLKPDYIP